MLLYDVVKGHLKKGYINVVNTQFFCFSYVLNLNSSDFNSYVYSYNIAISNGTQRVGAI